MDKADENEVLRLYTECCWTLRRVADRFLTNHHTIKRVLVAHGIEVTNNNRNRAALTDEHKRKIGERSRGRVPYNKGVNATEAQIRRYMAARMRTQIDLSRYPDLPRLQLLVRITSKHYQHLAQSDNERQAFLDKFYFNDAFNAIFDAWLLHDKNKWWYPSLDHIDPKANGGAFDLANLQFLTWFENRAKADMLADEWQTFKRETNTRSTLFIEDILENNNNRRT